MRGVFRGRRGWRRLAETAVVAALVASAGCSDEPNADSAGDTDSHPGETAAVEERSEAAEPADDADDERDPEDPPGHAEAEKLTPSDEPEPVIDLTGPVEEIERIYREQDAYESWLFTHPDPANTERLGLIVHRECPCWESGHKLLAHYAEHELWWTGPRDTETLDVKVLGQPSTHLVKLQITWERKGTGTLIDETGQVHSELPPAHGVQEVLMRRGTFDPNQPKRDRSGDPWKVITVNDLEYETLTDGGDG